MAAEADGGAALGADVAGAGVGLSFSATGVQAITRDNESTATMIAGTFYLIFLFCGLGALELAPRMHVRGGRLARIYTGMAMCLAADGKPASAIMYLEKALEIGPSPTLLPFVQSQLNTLKGE